MNKNQSLLLKTVLPILVIVGVAVWWRSALEMTDLPSDAKTVPDTSPSPATAVFSSSLPPAAPASSPDSGASAPGSATPQALNSAPKVRKPPPDLKIYGTPPPPPPNPQIGEKKFSLPTGPVAE